MPYKTVYKEILYLEISWLDLANMYLYAIFNCCISLIRSPINIEYFSLSSGALIAAFLYEQYTIIIPGCIWLSKYFQRFKSYSDFLKLITDGWTCLGNAIYEEIWPFKISLFRLCQYTAACQALLFYLLYP